MVLRILMNMNTDRENDEEEKGEKVIQHIHVQRDFGEYDSDINDDSNDDKFPRSKTDT